MLNIQQNSNDHFNCIRILMNCLRGLGQLLDSVDFFISQHFVFVTSDVVLLLIYKVDFIPELLQKGFTERIPKLN